MPRECEVLPVFEPGRIEFPPVPLYQYSRTLKDELAAGLSPEEARMALRYMLTIRFFEQTIVDLKNGRYQPLPGFKFIGATHLSMGQEASAVGTMWAIRPDDHITSSHRGHGHAIAKGAYWLEAQDAESLCQFIGEPGLSTNRDALFQQALREHLIRTFGELFGKQEGYCHGRGGGMHIADFHQGHLGANAIVGGSMAIATGAAMASMFLGTDRICVCMVGDGAANNGICHEAMNMACMGQFERGVPVIYLFENNQYGMTGQQVGEVTGIRYLSQRGAGYNAVNMHAETVNGMNVLAVRDAVSRAAALCRAGEGPVLIECETYRYMGHSLSDNRMTYRTEHEEECWREVDPIETFQRELIDAGVMTEQQIEDLRTQVRGETDEAAVAAAHLADPDPKDIYDGLYADTSADVVGDEWRTTEVLSEPPTFKRDGQGRILYRHAVIEALVEEMLRDRRVILYGEDVADYGGAFQATRGILEVFGRKRVFNTAISEAAIIGSGVGAAMAGMRPVVEIMYIDFMLMASDQLCNQAAKARYMFGGKAIIPLVVRTTIGGGKGYAGQHSQSLEALCTMFPGLKVVAPSTAYDVKGLLKTSIRDDNPIVFIEHQNLYTEKDAVPEGEEILVPLGVGKVRREGADITVVAWSFMASVAAKAAQMAAEEGISVELVDPRTLIPLDEDLIVKSVQKTGRLLVVCQAPLTGCFGEHIAYRAQERAFDAMKGPARIVAAHDVPPPMAAPLEAENLPSPEKVLRNIRQMVGKA
jgi:2-oxoisovalerate dehydrogenase E1 component